MDLGIIDKAFASALPGPVQSPLVSCDAPIEARYNDHTLDFGTGYDCLDPVSSVDSDAVGAVAQANRKSLSNLMTSHGFVGYSKEWWHFELTPEPFARKYFDFPIEAMPGKP